MDKSSIYIETTIIGYLTGRRSRDIVVLAHQEITGQWWDNCRSSYLLYTSEIVIQEAKQGDPDAAERRMNLLKEIPLLSIIQDIERLARRYMTELCFPQKSVADSLHLAYAVYYGMDYLLTWNCTHLANEFLQRKIVTINNTLSLPTPLIVTPEDLILTDEEV